MTLTEQFASDDCYAIDHYQLIGGGPPATETSQRQFLLESEFEWVVIEMLKIVRKFLFKC